MTSSPTYSKALDNFLVTLSLTDSSLYIDAEDLTTMKVFACKITPDLVLQLTEHLYQAIDDCYTGLKDGLEHQNDTHLSISQDGAFKFSSAVKIGSVTNTRTFQVKLEEKDIDRIDKVEREAARLRKMIEPLVNLLGVGDQTDLKKIGKLFSMMDDLKRSQEEKQEKDERLAQIAMASFEVERMKMKCMLETVYSTPLDFKTFNCVFDPNSAQKAQFDLSAGNKRVTRNANNEGSWYAMFAQNPLPSSGKHRISMRIDKYVGNLIAVGFAAGSLKANQYCVGDSGTFFFNENDNKLYHNGTTVQIPPSLKIYEGDIIHFLIDLDREIIRMEVNDMPFCRTKVNFSTTNNTGLYPCVNLGNSTSSVSFL